MNYCCDKFKWHVEDRDIVLMGGRYHVNDISHNTILVDIGYCPYCGKDLQPGLEVLFNNES